MAPDSTNDSKITDDNTAEDSWNGARGAIRVLSILIVLGLVLGAAGLLVPRVMENDGPSHSADRQEVSSRVEAFAKTYNTYDVSKVDDYQKRMKGLLTPSYDKEFVKVTDALFKALAEKKQKSGDANVLRVAVQSINDKSATALVAVDAEITNTDNKGKVVRHMRWKVGMAKQKGDWNVEKFVSVAGLDAENGQAPTKAPTPSPSTDGGKK